MNHRTAENGSELESLPASSRYNSGPVFRLRLPFLISSSSLLLAAILLSLFLPRQYSSTMEIVVHAPVAGANAAAFPVEQGADADRVRAELSLLRSEKLASDVVDPEWTNRSPEMRTPNDIRKHQAALSTFDGHLSTRIDPGSNVIRVSCSAADPHSATDLATRLLRLFLASQGELPRANEVTAFFVHDAVQARSEMEASQQALDEYRSPHVVNRPGRALATEQQIAELQQQMHETDEQIAQRAATILEGERRLASMPARREEMLDPDAGPALSVPQLTTMLAIYNDERATMLTRPITEGLRRDAVLELSHDIASTSTALHLAQRSRPPADDPATDPAGQQINDRVIQISNELHSLYADRDKQTESLADLRHALAAVQRPDADLALLQLKADATRTSWQLAEQRLSEARIVDVMDQQGHMNISVLLRPTYSNTPVSPGPWLIIVCVILGLVFLAVCLTIYLQRPREDDQEERAKFTIRLRGPASTFLRARRPNAYADLGRQPDRSPDPPSPNLPAPVPDHAQWEALATLLQADRERALEAESARIAEEEPTTEAILEPLPSEPLPLQEPESYFVPPVPPFVETPRVSRPASVDSEFVVIPALAESSRRSLLLSGPPALTAAVPNFVFESVQSTTTAGSLAFRLQATTLNPPEAVRFVPRQAVPPALQPEPAQEPEPILAMSPEPTASLVPEAVVYEPELTPVGEPDPSPAQASQMPPTEEVHTGSLPPLTEVRREQSPIPEIRTEPLPPVGEQILEAEPILPETSGTEAFVAADFPSQSPQPSQAETVFLRPSPSIPAGVDPPTRLTPFQRMKRRRAVPTLDKNGRATYITYTFDPDPDEDLNEKPSV